MQSRFAEVRARRALASAGLPSELPLVAVESATNSVWLGGPYVVRLASEASQRLRREARLASDLPPEVRYPEVVAEGTDAGFAWLVCRRCAGTPLVTTWPHLDLARRRTAVGQLATAVSALHATEAPPGLPGPDTAPQLLQPGARATEPLLEALERAASLPRVDRGVIDDLQSLVVARRGALDPFEASTLVHGDLHFQNVLWDGEQVSAVLDLEYARPAPPDLDLDVLLRFCAHPILYVPVGREAEARGEEYVEVPRWFAEAYPELHAHPRLLDRLRIYSIAFDVRDLLQQPPPDRESQLTRHHPYRRLTALLRGMSYLDAVG